MSNVKPIPEGYHSLTPYLYIKGAAKAIDFYKKIFGATETVRMPGPNGTIGHAELKIGDSAIMLADENQQHTALGPETVGGTPIGLLLYVSNVDDITKKSIEAGAKLDRPVENMFYGDRQGTITDPFGHKWFISTHIEDVTPDEMKKRMAAMAQRAGGD
jgi:PhnB protein